MGSSGGLGFLQKLAAKGQISHPDLAEKVASLTTRNPPAPTQPPLQADCPEATPTSPDLRGIGLNKHSTSDDAKASTTGTSHLPAAQTGTPLQTTQADREVQAKRVTRQATSGAPGEPTKPRKTRGDKGEMTTALPPEEEKATFLDKPDQDRTEQKPVNTMLGGPQLAAQPTVKHNAERG